MAEDEWTPDAVRARLKRDAAKGQDASAQVFFDPKVAGQDLGEVAQKAVDEAASRVGSTAQGTGGKGTVGKVTIGKVRPLAKSALVAGDPDVIAELFNEPSVKAILPSSIDDIYPKPINRREVE